MSVIVNSLVATMNNGIESEVARLRDMANNRIGMREAGRMFINQNLASLPVLVNGDYTIQYKDDRGKLAVKMEKKNHALWMIALQTAIEVGHSSYDLLCKILQDWAKDTLNVEWSKESAKGIAKRYIQAMQAMGVLSNKLDKMEYVDATGVTREGVVVKLNLEFNTALNDIVRDLREHSSMVCRPLAYKPMDWTDNKSGVGALANLKLVRGGKTKVAKDVLSAVNKLQAVEFIMIPAMIDAAYDMLDNQHEYHSTEEELMMYREVIAHNGSSCFFPITCDARGRMYYRGGILSPQGSDYCKALFQFAKGRELGARGEEALTIHLANTLGWDKKSLIDRKLFIAQAHDALMAIKDHVDVRNVFPDASVFQATVAVLEYQRMINSSNRMEFVSNLVCHQDGTCNGLQHMAAITKNRQTAVTVNCVTSTEYDEPKDIYGIIAEYAAANSLGEIAEVISRFGRDMAKNPVMITGYGAGEATIITNTAAYLIAKGVDGSLAEGVGKAYIAAINANAGAVKALTEALKSRVGQAMHKGQEKFTWTTADGFVASTEYRDEEVNRVRAGVFNAAVPNMNPTPLDDVKTVGAMSPNFIHSIDATHCRMVVNACGHELVTVHDSIGSHAATYFDTAAAIRTTFVEVHQYDALANLCEGMGVRTPQFRGDYAAHEALNSAYIFS